MYVPLTPSANLGKISLSNSLLTSISCVIGVPSLPDGLLNSWNVTEYSSVANGSSLETVGGKKRSPSKPCACARVDAAKMMAHASAAIVDKWFIISS